MYISPPCWSSPSDLPGRRSVLLTRSTSIFWRTLQRWQSNAHEGMQAACVPCRPRRLRMSWFLINPHPLECWVVLYSCRVTTPGNALTLTLVYMPGAPHKPHIHMHCLLRQPSNLPVSIETSWPFTLRAAPLWQTHLQGLKQMLGVSPVHVLWHPLSVCPFHICLAFLLTQMVPFKFRKINLILGAFFSFLPLYSVCCHYITALPWILVSMVIRPTSLTFSARSLWISYHGRSLGAPLSRKTRKWQQQFFWVPTVIYCNKTSSDEREFSSPLKCDSVLCCFRCTWLCLYTCVCICKFVTALRISVVCLTFSVRHRNVTASQRQPRCSWSNRH